MQNYALTLHVKPSSPCKHTLWVSCISDGWHLLAIQCIYIHIYYIYTGISTLYTLHFYGILLHILHIAESITSSIGQSLLNDCFVELICLVGMSDRAVDARACWKAAMGRQVLSLLLVVLASFPACAFETFASTLSTAVLFFLRLCIFILSL